VKPSNDNLSRPAGRVHFPHSLSDALRQAPKRYLWLTLGPALSGLVLVAPACRREAPTPADVGVVSPSLDEAAGPSDIHEAPTPTVAVAPPTPVAALPPGPNPTLPLSEHSGSITGPISWVIAESAQAQATSPLIVLLHGRGDNPESFVRLAWRLAERLRTPVRFVAARAPHPIGLAQGRQWFDPKDGGPEASLGARLNDFDVFFESLKATYPEAPPPVVVGFSQGAMMALHLAFGRPTAIAGAASLSGGLVAPGGQPGTGRPPVFIAAGAKDTIVPPMRSWQAADILAEAGFAVTRYPFDGSHRIDDDELDALGAWLRPIIAPTPAP